jgi:hypothetical protein
MANTIVYGVNRISLNFAGVMASLVAQQCKNMLGLSNEEVMKINGTECVGTYIVQDEDQIEFVKEAGTKGNDDERIVVTVQHGVNRVEVTVNDNSPVSEVLLNAAAILGITISEADSILVNGQEATATSRVQGGDRVEFRKNAGTKG